jgi:hypothetical protein
VREDMTSTTRVENWTPYEVKGFLDNLVAESGGRKLRIKGLRMAPKWFTAVGASGDGSRGGTYKGLPVTAASADSPSVEIVFHRQGGLDASH